MLGDLHNLQTIRISLSIQSNLFQESLFFRKFTFETVDVICSEFPHLRVNKIP